MQSLGTCLGLSKQSDDKNAPLLFGWYVNVPEVWFNLKIVIIMVIATVTIMMSVRSTYQLPAASIPGILLLPLCSGLACKGTWIWLDHHMLYGYLESCHSWSYGCKDSGKSRRWCTVLMAILVVEQSIHRVVGGKCIAVSNINNRINGRALLHHRHQGHHHNHGSN